MRKLIMFTICVLSAHIAWAQNVAPTPTCTVTATAMVTNQYSSSPGAKVTALNGTAPYTYWWSNDKTTKSLTAPLAGDYTVTVTDANGCTAIATVTVPLVVGTTAVTSNSATVNGLNGTAPYSYSWSNGETTSTAVNLQPGTLYKVTVTDSRGYKRKINVWTLKN